MAPGVGGNGSGGRQTGTVPKTKPHNGTSRYQPFVNHMPNNLSSLDWLPVHESHPHQRTRKESNTSASRFSESFDPGEEQAGTQDNLWFNPAQRGHQYNSDDDEVSQASWAENKSNNLGLPEKAQVASRLHQIRDYVSQTVSMMEGLRATGGQRNMAQHEKLASMLEGLRDSEEKLQSLYERMERVPTHSEDEPECFPAHQMMESPQERSKKPVTALSASSETARKNVLKKQVQLSHMKLQELQEQQTALKALRQKAQDELNEARAAQGALLTAHNVNQQAVGPVALQDRLHNLQRFFDTRHQLVHMVGLDDGDREPDTSDMQNKLDELQSKKHHMDQLLAQFSNLNTTNLSEEMTPEECERDVENKMAELNAMRETLAMLQNNISAQIHPPSSQERPVKKESQPYVEKSNATTSQALQVKTQQLQEAKSKLHQLQTLLQTVEELRELGQPVPESILQMMTNSDNSCSSPTYPPDRSEVSSQYLNISQPISERLVNTCDRSERGCRSINSCERDRVNHQQLTNSVPKPKNQEGKLGTKIQLEDLLRNQDINPQPLQSSSFQENSTTTGTWGGSTQGTLEDSYNPESSGEMNESASVKNATGTAQPHNIWRKPSTGSGVSQFSWVPQSLPRDTRQYTPRAPTVIDIPQPDSHWVVQQINQLQNQLRQMTSLCKDVVEKQHNCGPPPPWLGPTNLSAPLGPYCQYIASATQWQQQQLLVHSLNQCCQLIWHQQRELAALKEALTLLQQPQPSQEGAHFSPRQGADAPSTPPSNLQPRGHSHTLLKPSLSAGPSLAPPAVVSSAHSLPNLASPQTSPASPPSLNNRNLLSSPTATVLSLPAPSHPMLYPPYGNNLNFEFPSPVNFFPHPPEPFMAWATSSQPQPATTLNNQVPPGNRANNYWDNFRSYSRQNLLSNSGKSNDGLPQPQRTPMERFLNTDPPVHPRDHPQLRNHKERLNVQSEVELVEDTEQGEVASGYQHNLCMDQQPQLTLTHGRYQAFSPHSYQHNVCNEAEVTGKPRQTNENDSRPIPSSRLVNDCEAPRGANKKPSSERKVSVNKRNQMETRVREARISQLNNYQTEAVEALVHTEPDTSGRPANMVNCVGDGHCRVGVHRKDNKGNNTKHCKTEQLNGGGDSLELVYSEVSALISANEGRPQFLLQLFQDLRLLSAGTEVGMQAALSSIHSLATRSTQDKRREGGPNEEAADLSHKEAPPPPQLPTNCAKLDWEVRSVLVELLPYIKSQVSEVCGPALLECIRKLILHLVPSSSTQEQLDAQLEDALHKFHGTRLGDVYEELLTVVADVLISEFTFLRLVNTVHHSTEQQGGENVVEEEDEEEEGAVGGAVEEAISPSLLALHPANQPRRTKSETVSEADLAEADQSRHTVSGGEEERGETAEGIDQLEEEEASGRDLSGVVVNGGLATDAEASWAVEQDRELGLDRVPTRLHDPDSEVAEYNPTPPESSSM